MIVPNKHPSQAQARTLKLHVNLCHNHHRGIVITLQCLRSAILLPKKFRDTNLVILEATNTTCVLILIIITQKYTDIKVCKNLFKPLFLCCSHSLIFFADTSFNFCLLFSIFWGQIHINTNHEQLNTKIKQSPTWNKKF